jgi:intein/homing endonuclease
MSNLCVDGNTKVDAIVEKSKTVLTISEINELYSSGKEIHVLSKNIESNHMSYEKVLNSSKTMINAEVLEIQDIESGYKLVCTPNHSVFTKNRGYVEAKDLTENDLLEIIP